MPTNNTKRPRRSQGKNAPAIEKETAAQYRERVRAEAKLRREYEKFLRAEDRAREKEYKSLLNRTVSTGLYNPKSQELTPYRKRKLRKLEREHRTLLDPKKTIFVNVPPEASKKVRARASSLQMTATKKGVFVPREGHTNASIKYDKKHDEYYIARRGKTKSGKNKGRKYQDHIPLASLDELDKERERLRRAAKRIKLKGNEVLVFKVSEMGLEGFSHNTFHDIDALLRDLDRYPKTVAAKVNFFRHVRLEKSSSTDKWLDEHPVPEPGKKNRNLIEKGKFSTRRSKG